MNTIDNFSFKDKKALIRVDFNVPLDCDFHFSNNEVKKYAGFSLKDYKKVWVRSQEQNYTHPYRTTLSDIKAILESSFLIPEINNSLNAGLNESINGAFSNIDHSILNNQTVFPKYYLNTNYETKSKICSGEKSIEYLQSTIEFLLNHKDYNGSNLENLLISLYNENDYEFFKLFDKLSYSNQYFVEKIILRIKRDSKLIEKLFFEFKEKILIAYYKILKYINSYRILISLTSQDLLIKNNLYLGSKLRLAINDYLDLILTEK